MTVENNKILIVAMPKTLGHDNLNISDEVTAIQRHVESSAIVKVLTASTTAAVLQKITDCSLIHFACHGSSNTIQLSESALLLATEFTVDDLQPLNHQFAQVAYLSACSTAEIGVRSLINESIHLTSIFQLIDFRHVIETMWGVYDAAAAAVAAKFYEYLFEQNADTVSSVPRALHSAVLDLKTQDGNSENILLWASFIYVGP